MVNSTPDCESSKNWRGVVFKEEREALGLPESEPLTGLALSGGGIRSASFALGVIQALQKFECLECFHYLSTVSGGGYMGVALSWLRKCYPATWKQELVGSGTRRLLEDAYSATPAGAKPSDQGVWLDYLRQHGNYLQPPHIGTLALAGVAIRNLFLSIAVYVGIAAMLLAGLQYARVYTDPHQPSCRHWSLTRFDTTLDPVLCFDIWSISATAFALLLLIFVLYSLGSFVISLKRRFEPFAAVILLVVSLAPIVIGFRPRLAGISWGSHLLTSALLLAGILSFVLSVGFLLLRLARALSTKEYAGDFELYAIRIYLQRASGWLLVVLTALVLAGMLPTLASMLGGKPAATLITLVGAAASAYHAIVEGRKVIPKPIFAQIIIVGLFAVVVTSGALTAYYLSLKLDNSPLLFAAFCALVVVVAFCTNLNQFGIGRMYRDRLTETFMPDTDSIRRTRWDKACAANADDGLLKNLWPPGQGKRVLYPLINSNVVLTDSASDTYRGRGGDSFVLSPKFCGSDATGWVSTEKFADEDFKTGTAMAISGAAANPNTAPGGHGFSRNRLVSFLMFIAQVRLGAWVKNPGFHAPAPVSWLMSRLVGHRPNFLYPGLPSGLFGLWLTENSYFIELTDGGHFDNTGVYELIRRKAKLIVLSQASQDADFWLADLANLTEKVRVDFNARLYFGDGMSIQGVLPKNADGIPVAMAERGHAIASIRYGDKGRSTGWLVYLQATPLNALAVDVHSYHMHNRSFPNEPTANQFFREAQLEAYRELGYAVTKRFLKDVIQSRGASASNTNDICLKQIDALLKPQYQQ